MWICAQMVCSWARSVTHWIASVCYFSFWTCQEGRETVMCRTRFRQQFDLDNVMVRHCSRIGCVCLLLIFVLLYREDREMPMCTHSRGEWPDNHHRLRCNWRILLFVLCLCLLHLVVDLNGKTERCWYEHQLDEYDPIQNLSWPSWSKGCKRVLTCCCLLLLILSEELIGILVSITSQTWLLLAWSFRKKYICIHLRR